MRFLWPTIASLSGGRVLYQDRSGAKRLFITFDDGPSARFTRPTLDVLAKYKVPATFFMIGKHAAEEPELVDEVIARGHEIGNHSMNHLRLSRLDDRSRIAEIESAERVLRRSASAKPLLFRFPYGQDSFGLFSFAVSRGHRVALWSKDSLDYRLPATDVLRAFRARPVVPGDVLLFHDDGGVAAEVLRVLLPVWLAEGYSFHRLSDLSVTRPDAALLLAG